MLIILAAEKPFDAARRRMRDSFRMKQAPNGSVTRGDLPRHELGAAIYRAPHHFTHVGLMPEINHTISYKATCRDSGSFTLLQ